MNESDQGREGDRGTKTKNTFPLSTEGAGTVPDKEPCPVTRNTTKAIKKLYLEYLKAILLLKKTVFCIFY